MLNKAGHVQKEMPCDLTCMRICKSQGNWVWENGSEIVMKVPIITVRYEE